MRRVSGLRTSNRVFRKHLPSILPVADERSSSQTRERCMVSQSVVVYCMCVYSVYMREVETERKRERKYLKESRTDEGRTSINALNHRTFTSPSFASFLAFSLYSPHPIPRLLTSLVRPGLQVEMMIKKLEKSSLSSLSRREETVRREKRDASPAPGTHCLRADPSFSLLFSSLLFFPLLFLSPQEQRTSKKPV